MQTAMSPVEIKINNHLEILHAFTPEPDPELDEFLKSALRIKLEERETVSNVNTYLKPFEIPQIELFDILANRFPLVLNAQQIVNKKFTQVAENNEVVYLLDLGIGRGLQMSRVLESFNSLNSLKKLVLIGVEIFKPALDHTIEHFIQLKNNLNYELEFHSFNTPVESLDFDEVEALLPPIDERTLLVNASLTLHHVQAADARHKIFNRIQSLQPAIFTLIEPDADGFTDDFDQRLKNVYQHFTALFRYTSTLPLQPAEIRSLKTFFSNDFFDPIALPNESRFEKLQTSDEWIRLAKTNGFNTLPLHDYLTTDSANETTTNPEGAIIFGFEDVRLLTTMGFQ